MQNWDFASFSEEESDRIGRVGSNEEYRCLRGCDGHDFTLIINIGVSIMIEGRCPRAYTFVRL